MKRLGLILGGFCGFVCASGFALVLLGYITGGSGLQIVGLPVPFFGEPASSGSILIGLVHVVGFATAAFSCFAVGAGFCAHAIVSDRHPDECQFLQPNPRPAVDAAIARGLHSDDPSRGTTEAGRSASECTCRENR